ncbi:MAG: hypothetical protein JW798_11560 [Prolixibacteraceae bacterium]|nr:hypothetical protein [Prolixibacteraceae bacterium]
MNMNTEWLQITILILSLMNQNELKNAYEMNIRWEKPENFQMFSPGTDSTLVVDFRSKEDLETISTFIFFSNDNYTFKNINDSGMSIPLALELFSVTREMIIYKLNHTRPDPENLIKAMKRVFDVEKGLIETEDKTPLPENVQVLQYHEFPQYAVLSVAIPGSDIINPASLSELFPGKMILLSMVPDIGAIKNQWIKGKVEPIPVAALEVLRSSLEDAISNRGFSEHQEIYINVKEKLINLSAPLSQSDLDYLLNELERFLFYEPRIIDPFYDNDIFGNYQPKLSPDIATDYMPELEADLLTIPESKIENLYSLLVLFQEYQKNAIKNPGKWIQGNMVLGANPDEYIPSKEELLLNEVGKRIGTLIGKNNISQFKRDFRKEGLWGKTFCYTHFTFTHADVMGSGRFFYVDTMTKKCFTLKDGG